MQSEILHAECFFHTQECNFDTNLCDYDTLECDLYTQNVISTCTSVNSTRTRLIFARIVRFSHAECDFVKYESGFNTNECDFGTLLEIRTIMRVILTRYVLNYFITI
jgi:hypothetical protein